MTKDIFESSRHRGAPINLYYFDYGNAPGSFFAYTDAEIPVTNAGVTYTPFSIDHTGIESSGSLDKAALTIMMPKDNPLSELFRLYPPSRVVTVTIRQGHLTDPLHEYSVVWAGRVLNRDVKQDEVEFSCEPVATSIQRSGLRRNYQFGCPHVLYGSSCKASKLASTLAVNAVSVSGDSVTLADGWSGTISPNKYLGGMLQWTVNGDQSLRTILRIYGGKILKLSGIASGLSAGGPALAILGCSRQMDDCRTLHSNILNFGGQPWIPTKSPFSKASLYN